MHPVSDSEGSRVEDGRMKVARRPSSQLEAPDTALASARADAAPAPREEAAKDAPRPNAFARFVGSKKVRTAVVGVAAGASSIAVPLLAHHPGAKPASPVPPTGPAATAAPFPRESLPSASAPRPAADPTTSGAPAGVLEVPSAQLPPAPTAPVDTAAPFPTAPAAPALRPDLVASFPSLSGIRDVSLTRPHPGIQYLRFVADGPQPVHVVEIDLRRTDLRIRTSKVDERNQTVSSFAQQVGALVALNGDWFSYDNYFPRGLAVGEGEVWPNVRDLEDHLFLACDVASRCVVDRYGTVTVHDPSWQSVVGGNGDPLVVDGQPVINAPPFYSTDRHPRSAVGLTDDGRMFLIAAEGRQGDARGMTFNDMALLLRDLGVSQGMMLDGGGSTSLVLDGRRVSDLPNGAEERRVSNFLAIVPA
jgi:hypothetical protein